MIFKPSKYFAAFVIVVYSGPVLALPNGATTVAGDAAVAQDTATAMTVRQTTDRAVINWQGFSTAASESVRFAQPSASSVTLNRVTGANPSALHGSLSANGHVWISNPNGIVFGRTSQVNAQGLVATTLNVKNEEFLAGRASLEQEPGRPLAGVVNQGRIATGPGGQVVLVAPLVSNEGTIEAPGGQVNLAAGTRAVVNLDRAGLVSVGVRTTPAKAVLMSRDAVSPILEEAINTRSFVQAGSVRHEGGDVVLGGAEGVALNAGTIAVGSGKARIDSSQATIAAPGSVITANGGASGNGGEVRLMSQGRTLFPKNALIEARGGTSGGGGGFVEVSGDKHVHVSGRVDATAPAGRPGTFLIDPTTITIVDGNGGANDAELGDNRINAPDGGAVAFTISEDTIEALPAGQFILLAATGDIIVQNLGADNVLLIPNNASLQLTAGGQIVFQDPNTTLQATGVQTISMSAQTGITLANVNTTGSVQISTAAGDLTLGDVRVGNIGLANNISATGGRILDGNGAVANISGASVGLLGATGIGTAAAGGDIEVDVPTLSLSTTNNSPIFVNALTPITDITVGLNTGDFGAAPVSVLGASTFTIGADNTLRATGFTNIALNNGSAVPTLLVPNVTTTNLFNLILEGSVVLGDVRATSAFLAVRGGVQDDLNSATRVAVNQMTTQDGAVGSAGPGGELEIDSAFLSISGTSAFVSDLGDLTTDIRVAGTSKVASTGNLVIRNAAEISSGTLTLQAGGTITGAVGSQGVIGSAFTLFAGGGIGTADQPLGFSASFLDVMATGMNSSIFMNELAGFPGRTLVSVTATTAISDFANARFTLGGADFGIFTNALGVLSGNMPNRSVSYTNSPLTQTALGVDGVVASSLTVTNRFGDLRVGGVTASTVTLTSLNNNIVDANGDSVNITANTVVLNASGAAGLPGDPLEVNAPSVTINASVSSGVVGGLDGTGANAARALSQEARVANGAVALYATDEAPWSLQVMDESTIQPPADPLKP